MLPAALRARIALITLLGLFLIPVTTSSLRGLTHVLTCRADIDATLAIDTSTDAAAVLGSADRVTRGDDEKQCEEVSVQLDLASTTGDRAELTLEITNRSGNDRNGSVELRFSGVDIPVTVGRIPARSTETESVTLRVRPDRSYQVTGTLLLGP